MSRTLLRIFRGRARGSQTGRHSGVRAVRKSLRSNIRKRFLLSLSIATAALGVSATVALAAVVYGDKAGDASSPAAFATSMTLGDLMIDSKPSSGATLAEAPAAETDSSSGPWDQATPGTSASDVAGSMPAPMAREVRAFGISPAPGALPADVGFETQSVHSRAAFPEGQSTPATAGLPLADAGESESVNGESAVLVQIRNVNITFYDCFGQGFCGAMANGNRVYQGAAACSYDLPLGTRFYIHGDPTGRVYRCDDRGLLSNTWVDIFWYTPVDGWSWQSAVGRYGTIDVIEWGAGE